MGTLIRDDQISRTTKLDATAGLITGGNGGNTSGVVTIASDADVRAMNDTKRHAVLVGQIDEKATAKIDPTFEQTYWQEYYLVRPYVEAGNPYELYRPAYQYGWESYGKYRLSCMTFDELEPVLHHEWDRRRSEGSLSWDRAKHAIRDAWNHVRDKSP